MDSKSSESNRNNSQESINNSSLSANASSSSINVNTNTNNNNNKNRNNKRNFRKNNSNKKTEGSSNDTENTNNNQKSNKNGRYRGNKNNTMNSKKNQDNNNNNNNNDNNNKEESNEGTNSSNSKKKYRNQNYRNKKKNNNEAGDSTSNENHNDSNSGNQKSNRNHSRHKNNKKHNENDDNTSDNDSNLDEKSSKNFRRNVLMRKPKDFGKLTVEDSDSSSKESLKQPNSEDSNRNHNHTKYHRKENNKTHNQRLTNMEKVEIMTKKVTNSSDQDLHFNLIVELTNSTYECMVCYNVVKPKDHIWSCSICYNVFHLNCIKKWAKTDVSTAGKDGGWRCPGCQSAINEVPSKYTCFCGKIENPRFNPYITPHSCTNICGKPRDCSHSCREQCHPGPCPPCTLFAPEESCYCGKKKYTYRCSDLQKNRQIIMEQKCCGEVCGKTLNCGKHTCKKLCHPGPCDECQEKAIQTCYCGKESKEYDCGKEHKYSCHTPCDYIYPCKVHKCERYCHPQSEHGDCCPYDPS
eukprot:jgi/Orpsp1_1/1179064/evm.model.c7180000067794.1